MYKDILKSFKAAPVLLVLLAAACAKTDDPIHFSSRIIMADQASVTGDKDQIQLYFSTDGGATYSTSPQLSDGKKYKVKLFNLIEGEFLNSSAFQFDWSASNPAPSSAAAEDPEFTFADPASVVVTVDDLHCATDLSAYVGKYIANAGTVLVDGGPGSFTELDTLVISQDPGDPNGLLAANWFGVPTDEAKITFTESTTAHNQFLVVPEQTLPTYGAVTSGEGTYDQCARRMTIAVTWDDGSDVYTWTYLMIPKP